MIPKKASELYKPVAENLNVDVNFVEAVIEFYYKQLRIELSSLKRPRINNVGLGQFYIKAKAVNNVILKCTKRIDGLNPKTLNEHNHYKRLENTLQFNKDLKEQLIVLAKERLKFKSNIYEEYAKRNMEEPNTDS